MADYARPEDFIKILQARCKQLALALQTKTLLLEEKNRELAMNKSQREFDDDLTHRLSVEMSVLVDRIHTLETTNITLALGLGYLSLEQKK